MKYRIHFLDVGRRKRSWTLDLDKLDERAILKSISQHGGLISRNIHFLIAGDGGSIFAGFHCVGKIRVQHIGEQQSLSA